MRRVVFLSLLWFLLLSSLTALAGVQCENLAKQLDMTEGVLEDEVPYICKDAENLTYDQIIAEDFTSTSCQKETIDCISDIQKTDSYKEAFQGNSNLGKETYSGMLLYCIAKTNLSYFANQENGTKASDNTPLPDNKGLCLKSKHTNDIIDECPEKNGYIEKPVSKQSISEVCNARNFQRAKRCCSRRLRDTTCDYVSNHSSGNQKGNMGQSFFLGLLDSFQGMYVHTNNFKGACTVNNISALAEGWVQQQEDVCDQAEAKCRSSCRDVTDKLYPTYEACRKEIIEEAKANETDSKNNLIKMEENVKQAYLDAVRELGEEGKTKDEHKDANTEVFASYKISPDFNSQNIKTLGDDFCGYLVDYKERNSYAEARNEQIRIANIKTIRQCAPHNPALPQTPEAQKQIIFPEAAYPMGPSTFSSIDTGGTPENDSSFDDYSSQGTGDSDPDLDDSNFDPIGGFAGMTGGSWNPGNDSSSGSPGGSPAGGGAPAGGNKDDAGWPNYPARVKAPEYEIGAGIASRKTNLNFGKPGATRQLAKLIAEKGKFDPTKYAHRGLSSKLNGQTIFQQLSKRVVTYCKDNNFCNKN